MQCAGCLHLKEFPALPLLLRAWREGKQLNNPPSLSGNNKNMFETLGITNGGRVDKNAVAIYAMTVIFALDLLANIVRV